MSGKFALIIGNTEYNDPGLAQLTAPGKDAEDFARVLRDKEIGAFDNVNILLNQSSSTVNEAIDEFFDQKKPDDLLVLYFSGHGVRDELGALYLAVKNTIHTRLRSTAIKSDYIRDVMDQSRSKRQVLILDCCNSGAFAQGTKAFTGGSIGTAVAFEGGYGRIILTASDSTQFAWEGDKVIGETDNSLFTHYLIQGLEGEADIDGDGRITVDELYDYAYEKVRFATPKQTPSKFSSKQQGEIILRQSTRIENIKPLPLSDELMDEIEDTRPYVREVAVQKLEKILKGKNIGQARSAREALEKIVEDENTTRRVVQTATQVLESFNQIAQKTDKDNDTILKAEEEAAEKTTSEKTEREIKEHKADEQSFDVQTDENRLARQRIEAVRMAREREQVERRSQVIQPHPVKEKKISNQHAQNRSSPKMISTITGAALILLFCIGGAWATKSFLFPTLTALPTIPTTVIPNEVIPPITTFSSIGTVTTIVTPIITPSPTSEPTFTPTTISPIPENPADFIYYYFSNINSRNYDLTWSLLSNQYKTKTNPEGIDQYKIFWNGYNKIDINTVDYTYLTASSVKVSLKATFYKGTTTSNSKLTYYLISNYMQGGWLFDIAPAALGSATDTTCSTVPKRLSIGITAKVVTATDPLLLRDTPAEIAVVYEKMYPGTIVTVVEGPICGLYREVYFWWWRVQAPSGKVGWVVEGSDVTDLIFIQPAN